MFSVGGVARCNTLESTQEKFGQLSTLSIFFYKNIGKGLNLIGLVN